MAICLYTFGCLVVIIGFKLDYTFPKWGDLVFVTGIGVKGHVVCDIFRYFINTIEDVASKNWMIISLCELLSHPYNVGSLVISWFINQMNSVVY